MSPANTKPIHSPAIGATIDGLRYEADAGYVVIELDSGEELWVSADRVGCHVFAMHQEPGSATCR